MGHGDKIKEAWWPKMQTVSADHEPVVRARTGLAEYDERVRHPDRAFLKAIASQFEI